MAGSAPFGAKYGRGAALAGQRVVHIARGHEGNLLQPRIGSARIDAGNAMQLSAAMAYFRALGVKRRTPIACAMPAPPSFVALPPAENNRADAFVQRRRNKLAGAARRRRERIAPPGGTSASPEATAISIIAVFPSPSMP